MAQWDPQFHLKSPIYEPFLPLMRVTGKLDDWPNEPILNTLKGVTGREVVNDSGLPVCFVSQQHKSINEFEQQYEAKVFLTGEVMTRSENWHDFFNALVWITFPKAKAALNRIHYQEMANSQSNTHRKRGPIRDAATLFDESGVIVLSSQSSLMTLLKRHEWKTVFWKKRASVISSMRFIVFGHALYEKTLSPYLGMTAKGVFFNVEEQFLRRALPDQLITIDQWLADFLRVRLSCSADLAPVPILGYPGWMVENDSAEFYDNRQYFRPCSAR